MSDVSEARLEAAAALRDLSHALVSHEADDVTLTRVAEFARSLIPPLREAPARERVIPTFGELASGESGPPDEHRSVMADRAIAGLANPTAVQITTPRAEGDDAAVDVVFGRAFEGAPGRVHGGMVAAVFDDVTGYALAFIGEPAFTGRLSITYRAPVPIERTVEFRSRLRERTGRRLFVEAAARLGNKVLASAEATFIVVGAEHFGTHAADLLETREA